MASLELPEAVSQTQMFSSEERTRPEHLPSALAFASGSAVTQAIVSTLVKTGGHIISVGDVYGGERRKVQARCTIDMLSFPTGTYRYFTKVAATSGIQTNFLDLSTGNGVKDLQAHSETIAQRLDAAFRPDTQLVWIETPTNPTLMLIDIELVSSIAHKHGAIVVVDNTFMSPYYQQPLRLGADIVTHSVTKYINGHSE